jgi:hypothetical protein
MKPLDRETIHFGSFDDRFCGFKGTRRFTTDENEVNCKRCKENDRVVITEQGKQTLRDLGYEVS